MNKNEIIILGMEFGAEAIRINFIEHQHTTKRGAIEQALTMGRDGINDVIEDIEYAVAEIIEEYFVSLREPPEVLPAGDRLRRRREEEGPAMTVDWESGESQSVDDDIYED